MYAIFESGGKQYRAAVGQNVLVDAIDSAAGSTVTLDKVLAVVKESGPVFGNPYVEKASVQAEIISTDKQDKVLIFKHKKRRNHRKLRGHRQQMTTIKIKDIKGV